MTEPLPFIWDGEAMRPASQHWAKKAAEAFAVGGRYRMTVLDERSAASHNQFFAALEEGFANLPEDMVERFASVEQLRKYLLIRTGYRKERTLVCSNTDDAARIAAFIRPMDDYAIVSVALNVIRVWTAESQSYKEMGRKRFQSSKQSVLDLLAEMIGVETKQLEENIHAV